jgi:toxin ParE1/3/4
VKPVVVHRDAEAELDAAIAWYENQREGLGIALQSKVEDAIKRIQTNPKRHAKHKGQDIRKCRVKRFPYSVCFLEMDDVIWIAAIAHDKRKPDYWAAREPED